jgi:CSLREA domain-containing protein
MRLLIAGPLAMIASLLLAASAMAGIRLSVTTTTDSIGLDGQCSLREAINASNNGFATADCPSSGSPMENQIGFAAALGANPVIALVPIFGALPINGNDVTITGPATVNGATNSGFRVITSSGINLTLTSLTISNGSENSQGLGGGIRHSAPGQLVLNNTTVSQNKVTRFSASGVAVEGGGIYSTGKVTLNNSTVANNEASAALSGGGIGGVFALGGGVEAEGADVAMENSVVSGNKVLADGDGPGGAEADGGGVRSDGDVLIEHSTISGNLVSATASGGGTPTVQGGGMLFHGSEATIDVELSTIANNLMKAPASTATAQQLGGGIENFDDSVANYISDTIVGNGLDPASQTGGVQGLNFQSAGVGTGSRTFDNTIIANPVGSVGSNCFGDTPYSDDSGAPNVEFPSTMSDPCFDDTHLNVMHADPLLGALGNNGGPTPTMVPAATSPVIDQGTADTQNDLTEDQRGLTRPVTFAGLTHPFDGSDIGAVEVQATCAGQTTPGGTCPAGGGSSPAATPVTPVTPSKKKCKKKGKKAEAANKKCKKKKGKK